MKNFCILIFILLMISQSTLAKVDPEDLQKIHLLINDKKYAEALEAHQKFFVESKGTSLSAVRTSFGLSNWAELGKVYPPAHKALVQMALERKNIIYTGVKDFDVLQEYTAINRYIDQEDESIKTFLHVEKSFPEQARSFFIVMKALLIAKDRYDIIKRHLRDPIYEFENLRHNREHSLSQLRQNNGRYIYTLEQINSEFDEQYKVLLETTKKIDLQDEAAELKRRYDDYFTANVLRKYH